MVLTQKDIDEALSKALVAQTQSIKELLDQGISAIRQEIIATLQDENKKLHSRIVKLENHTEHLEGRIDSLESKLESNLQYQRNSSVIVNGIPREIEHHKLEGILIDIFNKVCFHSINTRDIIACHRLSVKTDSIILKFVNKKDALALLGSKLSIKEIDTSLISENCKNIYVNEHLTPFMGELAYHCRCLKRAGKIYQSKVENGLVKVLTNKGGSFRWFIINNTNDLDQFNEENTQAEVNNEKTDGIVNNGNDS